MSEKVSKCPACGSLIQTFSSKCNDCGYEFRDVQSEATINRLFEMLLDADNLPKDELKVVNKNLVDGIFGKNMDDEQKRFDNHNKAHRQKIYARKVQIISNFPVPNTKEALLEFITLGISKAKQIKRPFYEQIIGVLGKLPFYSMIFGRFIKPMTDAEEEHNALANAWRSKLDHIVMKAKISMKDDRQLLQEIDYLIEQLNSKK
jgi:hypothetical protein